MTFPVNFEALAQQGGNPAAGGYPYQIKGADLMRDFVYAALDADDALIEEAAGQGGYTQRKLKLSPGTEPQQILFWDGSRYVPFAVPPSDGTYVLGAVGGVLSWIETEACE
jgi:hypothetical protein